MAAPRKWPKLHPDDSWSGRSIEERSRAIEAACRAAMQLLEEAPDREERLRHQDPVPASTRALLRRLAAEQWKTGSSAGQCKD